MNIQEELTKIFGQLNQLKIDERISTFRIKGELSAVPKLTEKSLVEFYQKVPDKDQIKISFAIDTLDPIVLIERSSAIDFISEFNEYFEYYEPDDESIIFSCEIDKATTNESISVYSFSSLNEFIGSKTTIDFLKILTNLETNSGRFNFQFLESSLDPFHSKLVSFGYEFEKCDNLSSRFHLIQANCYYNSSTEYPFTPSDFHIVKRPSEENSISSKLDTLKSLFSIISIFDFSTIYGDDLEYRLKGYKLFQGKIFIDEKLNEFGKAYFELFEWIYSSEGNVADKLGIARNIISLHIGHEDISIDDTLIHSIKSAHQTYLKENVSSYLNLRANLLDELGWVSQKSSEVIKDYLQAYKHSSLTFLSFFISIFLLRTLRSGSFLKIFTNEVTIIAIAFLILSLIYLCFSRHNVLSERNRLKRKYTNIKNRYKDLLIEQDIKKILDDDLEFKYEIDFINSHIKSYTWLWLITIGILIVAILSISELISFSFFYYSFQTS